jgi:hypothetical protein
VFRCEFLQHNPLVFFLSLLSRALLQFKIDPM